MSHARDPDPLPLLDLDRVPWSRHGSFMALSTLMAPSDHPGREVGVAPGLHLFDLSGARLFRWNGVFRIDGLAPSGDAVPVTVREATPARLTLTAGSGRIEVAFDGPDTLRFRGEGTGLRLSQAVIDPLGAAIAFPRSARSWRLQMGEDAHHVATALHGELRVEAPRVRTGLDADAADRKVVDVLPAADGTFELALTQYQSGYAEPAVVRPFEACVADAVASFGTWLAAMPAVPGGFEETRAQAAALTWSACAGPRGLLARPAMLMSKHWMHAVWSWDHAFNALGLAPGLPDAAWDQLMLPFDHQHPQGALPDILTDHARLWGFVKPPVHGWALRRLAGTGIVSDERLAELHPRLAAWTEWWFRYRDDDGDGLPEVFHGNDTGQDNATAFDTIGFPAVSPDVIALLVVQMDVLAWSASRLGRHEEAAAWRARADVLLGRMLERLWDGRRFRAIRPSDGASNPESRSQIAFLPMILDDRLPPEVRTALVAGFRTSGLVTAAGIASEAPDSRGYEPDGYWRGPVWAPTTLLLVDGLRACGAHDLADRASRAYLETCRRSGFAENHDALTGAPLRDPGYTWSASVFLVLASETAER